METLVKHDQRNLVKNNRTFDVKGTQTTTIGKGRSTTIYTGNDIKNVLSGNLIETISLLRSTQARDIFKYATNRIELEVGEQTSLTMDNEKILLRFGKNTILMNQEGIWLDGKHIGLQEKELDLPRNTQAPDLEEKSIVDLYWSYGDECIRLGDVSRYYSDLNLHIITKNYRAGDIIEAEIEYDGKNGKENFSISTIIGENNETVILNVFSDKKIVFNGE